MRIKYFFAFVFIVSAIFLSPGTLRAQVETEAVIEKKADAYFENGDYPAAMPLYSQLLSNHKENPNYNYRYGVCVIFASTEKDKGLQFLEKASKSPGVDADVWFYLGKAYHLNYQFEQAITAYNKYKSLAGPKKAEKMQVDNQIAMCKTGRKLLKAITDITVLDRAELNEADFFRRYDLRGAGYSGQLLVKPDEFKTALDKKKNEQSIIFLSGEKTELYFASYGEDETQGKDIYVVRKLPNGTWGKPQNVGYPINTEYDEDYPFLHPNGKVLYFSSKGHNSMGGYDIFRSELNEDVGTWQKPVNLDFAINSPDDDIMFISDLDEKTAWFASNRSSPEGKMTVYHVVIERKPVNMCLIAGSYTPTNGDPNRSAKITVKNAETNEPIGVYKSNEATGAYLINLPNNGGKYTFTVDHSGIATQTEDVFVPPQYSIKTLNQKIGYNEVANESKLFIMTDFDADTSMLDPTFLKDKAKLDINNDASTATQIVDMGQHTPGTLPEAGSVDSSDGSDTGDDSTDAGTTDQGTPPAQVRNDELLKSANEDAAATQQEAIDLNIQKDKAWTNAADINNQAKAKTAEAKKAKDDADAMPEGPDKVAAENAATQKQAEANALQSQAAAAISIAQGLDNDAKQKQVEADKTKQYATALDKAIKSKDPKSLDAAVALGSELQAMSDARSQSGQTAKNLQDEADKKHKELDKAKTEAQDLRDEIAQNEERINQLNAEKAKEKDPELRNGIDSQIEGINEDISDDKKLLAAADKKADAIQNQANDIDNQLKGANDALAQSKNPSVTGSAVSDADKKALQADADSYQQSISETGTSRPFAAVTGTQTSGGQQSTVGSQTSGTQTSGSQQSTVSSQTSGTQTSGSDQSAVGSQTSGTQTSGSQQSAVGSQTSATQTSGSDQSTVGSQTSGTQTTTGTDSDHVVVAEIVDPGIGFTESIQKTDTITDPVQREKAKAAVYSDWSAAIDDEIRDKKQELAGTTDKTKKAEINADIKKLQDEKKQKDADAKASLAAADKEQKAQIANQPAKPVVDEQQFITQLNAADAKGTTAEKENTKVDIYNAWADSLDAAASAKEKGLTKIKDKKAQEQAKADVAALRADADAKRSLADDAHEKAVAAETSSQPVASTTTNDVKYDDPGAATALDNQKKYSDAAAVNRAKKDSLTTIAASATGDDKNKLLTAATEQQRIAWDNDAKASAALGDANTAQFQKNDSQLKGFDAAGINSNDQNVSVAGLLSGEARNLFEKAKQERDSANATTNNFIKTELLQNAEDNERKAIQKQQEALALYTKSGIQPVAVGSDQSAVSGQQSVVGSQTSGTQTSGSDQSAVSGQQSTVSSQTSGTQTSGSDQSAVGSQTSGTQTSGSDQSAVGSQTSGTQTSGSDQSAVGSQTSGTQTSGSDQSAVGSQTSGTQTSVSDQSTSGSQTSGMQSSSTEIVDASTGEPISSVRVNEIRGSSDYKNYLQAGMDAVKADAEAEREHKIADQFQLSADSNVAKAQDLSLQAADEKDKTKKKELLDQSNHFNELAKQDMASRDSVNDLAGSAEMDANAKRNNQRTILQGLDPKVANEYKAVATADQRGNPLVAKSGTQTSGSDQSAVGSQTSGTQTSGSDQSAAGSQTSGTQTSGSDQSAAGSQTSGTQTSGSDQSAVGSQTSGTQTSGTQTASTGTQPGTQQSTAGTPSGTQQPGTQSGGTDGSSVTQRLAPGEELKLAPATAATTAPKIDVNPSLPEGLVYKVQIGAFRNPISAEIYKGISPVTAETTASGLTRYTAGFFTQFPNADDAKNEIRKLGYKDAFVVAFYNGKRISIDEARRISGQPLVAKQDNGTQQTSGSQTSGQQSGSQTSGTQTSGSQTGGTEPVYSGSPNVVKATDVKELKGLFYTVQIGVYNSEVSKARLKNLPDIVSAHINNQVRYSSGKYCTPEQASVAKNNAVAKGISDAFVTAYYKGERITLSQAKDLVASGVSPCSDGTTQTTSTGDEQPVVGSQQTAVSGQQSDSPSSGTQSGSQQPSTSGSQTSGSSQSAVGSQQPAVSGQQSSSATQNTPLTTQDSQPAIQNPEHSTTLSTKPPVPETGLVYSVQIGAFREEVPVDIANQFLQLASKGVKNYLDQASGLTVYQFGVCTTKEEAEALREEAVKVGITDAFIVVFKDGRKIPMEDAGN
jgi:hypothetical protein